MKTIELKNAMNSKSISGRIFALAIFATANLLCFVSNSVHAQVTTSMFNGVDLSQWERADGSKIDKGWIAENGTIFRESGGGDIFFKEEVGDFVFSFEWKISEKGNSGVKYRVRKYGNTWLGCEYQILHDDDKTPMNQRAGAIYALFPPTENKPIIEADTWYRGRIVVSNKHVQHRINDQIVVDAQIGSPLWFDRVKASKFGDREEFSENQTGRIMLQDHGNQVWFRNLTLIRLNSYPSYPLSGIATSSSEPIQHSTFPFENQINAGQSWGSSEPIDAQSNNLVYRPCEIASGCYQPVHQPGCWDSCNSIPFIPACRPSRVFRRAWRCR